MDRPVTVSAPYSGALNDMTSGGVTTTTYDALSRPLSVTDANGGYTDYSYTKNDVLLTLGPAPTGENTKRKQEEWDGLDRLKSVCELTSTANGGGTCGQSVTQTGYWTEYTRNPLGQITAVTQNAQGSATQSRSFSFDWLGRLVSESNPEDGTTSYTFDTDTTCGTSDGDLVKRVDNAGNVTCYAHDALHRVTKITYPTTASGFTTAPEKEFVYGAATVDSASMANVKGKLARACTVSSEPATPCDTTSGYVLTDLGFSYPNPGSNEEDVYQSSPHSGGYYEVTVQHYPNGAASTLTLPGVPAISYGLDGEGRSTTVSAASGQNPATAATYSALGLGSLTLGSSTPGSTDSDAYTYDSNTGRMATYTFTVGGVTDTGTLTWNANGSLQKLQIADNFNSADSGTCTYTHDDLGRVASASCGTPFSLTYSFDPFGNMKASGTPSAFAFSPTFTTSSNRISGEAYDSDGNLKDDPVTPASGVNGFDADGHATTLEGITVTYDALGRAVEAAKTGGTEEFLYGPGGGKLAVMSGQTLVSAYVPLPGGAEAVYNSSGLAGYHHADWEGSARLASTPSKALSAVTAYGPYGEIYAEAGSGAPDRSFTGQKQDIDTAHSGGQYGFLNREYNPIQGRWWTPDPAGLDAVDPNNPQTWNRYAYVAGNPLMAIDPFGLAACDTVSLHRRSQSTNADADAEFGPYDPGSEAEAADDGGCYGGQPMQCSLDGLDIDCGLGFALGTGGDGIGGPGGGGSPASNVYQCPWYACEATIPGHDGEPHGLMLDKQGGYSTPCVSNTLGHQCTDVHDGHETWVEGPAVEPGCGWDMPATSSWALPTSSSTTSPRAHSNSAGA
jgi:RHS repeat-associated protein